MSMTSRALRIAAIWLAWAGALVAGPAALADVNISLRPSAKIAAGNPTVAAGITLGEVVDFDPADAPEAASLTSIVVTPGRAGVTKVTIADVRASLDSAKVNWGRVSLRGSTCMILASSVPSTVRPAPASGSPAAKRSSTPSMPPATGLSRAVPQPVDLEASSETMRGAIATRLVDLYGVSPADLRLAFDPADEPFLNELIAGRRVDVQPTSTSSSARTPMNIFVYDGDRIAESKVISAQALIGRDVLTARQPISRGQLISAEVVEPGRQWIAPNTKPPVTQQAAFGQVAARAINAGAILTGADVIAPIACKRGDEVFVHVLCGLVTVRAKCRAQCDARDGEPVQLKLDGSSQVFTARMSGPGQAVMLADRADDATGRASTNLDDAAPAPYAAPPATGARPSRKGR